jgi:hypothetical protein
MPAQRKHLWASLGASVRLQELEQERAEILRAFPHLRKARRAAGLELATPRRRRRMSAAARKAMSAGMRKHWARRRAEDATQRAKKNGKASG